MPGACSDGTGPGEPPRPMPPDAGLVRRMYQPTVTPGGELVVAGCPLGQVERGPDGRAVLVLTDRCRPRSQARGTNRPAVVMADLLAAASNAVGPEIPLDK